MKKEELPMKDFENHVLTVLIENDIIKRYQYKQPDTGCFGFMLTCSEDLIVMTGDCYTFIATPGYGRCGLAFLRGSVKSTGYFLSKCPLREDLSEYKYRYALEDMEEFLTDYCEEEESADKMAEFKDELSSEDGTYGQMQYFELCSDLEIEEPPNATRMTSTAKMQLAGLISFVEEYERLQKGLQGDKKETA